MNPRVAAAKTISQVVYQKQSLATAIPNATITLKKPEDIALYQELCYGTLRWYHQLEVIAHQLLLQPVKKKQRDIFSLLLLGLYQLIYTRIPNYAAVSETVTAAKQMKKIWATGLLNKTLRRFINEKAQLLDEVNQGNGVLSHPTWLTELIQQAWPDQWQQILQANNAQAPMFLRINEQLTSVADYQQTLRDQQIEFDSFDDLNCAIRLHKPMPVAKIPGFEQGLCSVQDLAGQYVAQVLDLQPKHHVLDACSAPGSKTSHILETQPKLNHLVAIDCDANRLAKVKDNIDRLKLPHDIMHLVLADAAHTKQWWDGQLFDRILLDAPCSGTGVIRRHPDIKLLRRESDIKNLAQQQIHLLNALWPLLNKGGKLLYTTCSILPQENEQVIAQFIREHKDCKSEKLKLAHGIEQKHGRQVFPQIDGMDGFYYCLLYKK